MIENNQNIKFQTFVIDTIKIGTPQHEKFIKFQNVYYDCFVTILGIRVNQSKQQFIEVLALEDAIPFQIKDFVSLSDKLKLVFDLLKSLWFLNSKQYFSDLKPLQKFIFYCRKSKHLKTKPYVAVPYSQFKHDNPKKDKQTAKKAIQFCFQFKKSPESYDIWKWAVFASQLLFQFSFQNYIQKVLKSDKLDEFIPDVTLQNRFSGDEQILKILIKCLNPNPEKRPLFKQAVVAFNKAIIYNDQPLNSYLLDSAKKAYQQKQKSIDSKFQLQIKQDIILTDDFKKKLSAVFVRNGLKAVKSYKPVYRATRFSFNTRSFYEKCFENGKLLFIIETIQFGTICFYLESTLVVDDNLGFQGNFIADPSCKSFIYSTKNQQSYKLHVKQKAFRVVPGKGPIIGDGDIILGDNPNQNSCNFPKSYQTGKHKTLMPKNVFSIKNYDVYIVTF